MRVLLDECVHGKVKRSLSGHEVKTVQEVGWRGILNGKLLSLASSEYDVFITSDKNLQYQQHILSLPLPVIIIRTKGNMWEDIAPILPKLESLLSLSLESKFYSVE